MWQRSSAASALIKGGRHRGTKLYRGSMLARQEKSVFTTQSSGSPLASTPQASSWQWIAPVCVEERWRKQRS